MGKKQVRAQMRRVKPKAPAPGQMAQGTTRKQRERYVQSGGTLQGFATGDLHGPRHVKGTPHTPGAELRGNLTATYSAAGGFTAGSLGTGAATDTAIAVSGSCSH